jgi:hypothetical protein
MTTTHAESSGITGAKGVAGRYLDLTIRLRARATGTGR